MTVTLPTWRDQRPVLVGPWTSEMGFECLYWLPWLAQEMSEGRLDPSKCIIVTRGGAGAWYPPEAQSVELYDYVPPADLRLSALSAQTERASVKQLAATSYEAKVLELIAARLGLRRYRVLHPSAMYRALDPWWTSMTWGLKTLVDRLRIEPIRPVTKPVGLKLPLEPYVAMRWYARPTWPVRQELVEWVHAMTLAMANQQPVVWMTSAAHLDDHVDFPAPPAHQNLTILQIPDIQTSLAVQTSVIQGASQYVGTWGGLAQLAVRCGVPTAAAFDRWTGASYAHRIFTEWIGLQTGVPVFVGRPVDFEAVRLAMPSQLAVPVPSKGSSS